MDAISLTLLWVLFLLSGVGSACIYAIWRMKSNLATRYEEKIMQLERELGPIVSSEQARRDQRRIAGLLRRFQIGGVEVELPTGKTLYITPARDGLHLFE